MSDLKNSEKDDLLTLMEEMQDEIESLKAENEQLRQIPSSSSETSELKSLLKEVQSENRRKSRKISQQEQIIQQLNVKIESLNNSDLQLKEAQNLKDEADTTVQAYKDDAELARKEAEKSKADADSKVKKMKSDLEAREKAADEKEALLNDMDGEAGRRARKLYNDRKRNLDHKYQIMTAGYKGRYYMSLIYGIFITILMAARSEIIINEAAIFFSTIYDGLKTAGLSLIELGGSAAAFGDMIPQKIIAFIAHWLIQLVVSGGIGIAIVFIICMGTGKVVEIFNDRFADEKTAFFVLMGLAVIVIYADKIVLLPVNLILLYILVFAIYMISRAFLELDDAEQKKELILNVGRMVLILGVIWFAFRSFA